MTPDDHLRTAAERVGRRIDEARAFLTCEHVMAGTDTGLAICPCETGADEALCLDCMAEHLLRHQRCVLCDCSAPLGLIDGRPFVATLVVEHPNHAAQYRRTGAVSIVVPTCSGCRVVCAS